MDLRKPLMLVTLVSTASAETLHVPDEFSTIQAAINAARGDDVVLVQPGIYVETLTFLGKNITVTSTDPHDPSVVAGTIVDARGQGSVVSFVNAERPWSVLAGLTITGGTGTEKGYPPSTVGGGIYIVSADPTISRCLIRDNRVRTNYYYDYGGTGAGVFCERSSAAIEHSRIIDNLASLGGGGVFCRDSDPIIRNCFIRGNYTDGDGGGLTCDGDSAPLLEHCIIHDNTAGRDGGGLCTSYARFSAGAPTLNHCSIVENTSHSYGGGLYVGSSDSPVLNHCTILRNFAHEEGGGVNVPPALYGSLEVKSSILWNNLPEQIHDKNAHATISYSDIQDGWEGDGNIDADPRFCNVGCGALVNIGIAADSPCAGTGEGGTDMGAYGVQCDEPAEPPSPGVIEVPADHATIRRALAVACVGDTILLAPGTYAESELEIPSWGLVLLGWDPTDSVVVANTVIKGEGEDVIIFRELPPYLPSALAGLTVADGGHGITCVRSSPTITHAVIRDSDGGEYGGGLFCDLGASPLLNKLTITGNIASYGGGGIRCDNGSSPIISDCAIALNSGSGVSCAMESSPTLEGCSIVANGAGISGFWHSAPRVSECVIADNQGPGLSCGSYCAPTLNGCTIKGNKSGFSAGGVDCSNNCYLTLENCTISGNSSFEAGGLNCGYDCAAELTSCIVWGNAPQELIVTVEDSVVVGYSDIRGGWPGDGNIDADPRFCDDTCARFADLGLAGDSPCLRTGHGGENMGAWGQTCGEPVVLTPVRIEVPSDYASIQAALDVACEADTIVVAPGTYREAELVITMPRLLVRSWDPLDPEVVAATLIDGDGDDVILFEPSIPDQAPTIAGFTITGGGHGIQCRGSAPRIEYCVIAGNELTLDASSGAGVSCRYAAPLLLRCSINNNRATREYSSGGGLSCLYSSPQLTGCRIYENEADDGGGIYCWDAAPTLIDCGIENNSSAYSGGGVYCDDSSPLFRNCTISNNAAPGNHGGGFYCESRSEPVLLNCSIRSNSSGWGGGLFNLWDSSPSLINCIIAENHAGRGAGGAYCADRSSPSFMNCIIADNSTGGSVAGGGVYSHDDSHPTLTNSILWRNDPDQVYVYPGHGADVRLSYCDVQGGWEGNGNIKADPAFVSWAGFDYMLNPRSRWVGDTFVPRSTCIDAGDPAIEDGVSDRHPRWPLWYSNGARSDMGAYGGERNAGWLPGR